MNIESSEKHLPTRHESEAEVVGWGNKAPWAHPDSFSISQYIGRELAALGVQEVFGILGGGIAAFADGLCRNSIRFFHSRHESGAVFSAMEGYFATQRPGVAVVTTGPGIINALNGVMAARADGAKLLLISGGTSRAQMGRGTVQETHAATMPAGILNAGPVFHLAAQPETSEEVTGFLQALAIGWKRKGGFVAHLCLPTSLQTLVVNPTSVPPLGKWEILEPFPSPTAIKLTLQELRPGKSVVWLGHGASEASAEIRKFVEAAQLPVIASPRAKGVFDENHPNFVGVSGAGGQESVQAFMTQVKPEVILVLGSQLSEVTSFLAPFSKPLLKWIHVDVDPSAFGKAFPGTAGIGIVCSTQTFVRALDEHAIQDQWYKNRLPLTAIKEREKTKLLEALPRGRNLVRTPFLMQVIQQKVVDATDALVMSESGNAFTWCNFSLRFSTPGRYRTSAAWGSMGHFTAGVVGAGLLGTRRAVAVVGDGAMHMNHELNTAVAYHANSLWIILNDSQLGLNEHGMSAYGMKPIETQLPKTDFAALAKSMGARGISVTEECELAAALELAMSLKEPTILDVRIDPTIPSPIIALRVKSLQSQGRAATTESK